MLRAGDRHCTDGSANPQCVSAVLHNLKHHLRGRLDTLLGVRVLASLMEDEETSGGGAAPQILSPPMVSRAVADLRAARRRAPDDPRDPCVLSLTEAGAIYHERCVRLLSEIEEAEEAVGSVGRLPRGGLRLSAPSDFGAEVALRQGFHPSLPAINVD